MSRDLKADYRELWSRLNESWDDWNDFKIAHGEHWLERAIAEKERANKYKALVRERENQIDILSTTLAMYCSPYYDMQERADKYEIILRELTTAAENYISEDGPVTWNDFIRQFDALEAGIAKAKEVLRDDALRVR